VLVELYNREIFKAGLVVVGTLAYMSWLNEHGAISVAMPSREPSTSVKLPGREGLRVDVLAPGPTIGATIQVPELDWHAQTVPYYDYLLEDTRQAAVLAGGHCIPVVLPNVDRMIWHKLYSSTQRTNELEKAEKDLIQAVTLAAIIVERDGAILSDSFHEAPQALRAATLVRMPRIQTLLTEHPEARDAFGALTLDR
jgi:hypothetical protein